MFEHNDTCLLIDDACEPGSAEQIRVYVQQILQCAVHGIITEDTGVGRSMLLSFEAFPPQAE